MRIEHVAIWTSDLERLRAFYERYFGARAGDRYENPAKQFRSYFLCFESGARLELMQRPELPRDAADPVRQRTGFIHLAFVVGDEAAVDTLTERLREAGHPPLDGPRRTGDGYYESVVLDPDGNRLEITAQARAIR
jgi:lactoylglutathione lyase